MGNHCLCDRKAECPFFRKHTPNTITCEGIIADTTETMLFKSQTSKKLQYELYCCFKYETCPRYTPLMNKYKEE